MRRRDMTGFLKMIGSETIRFAIDEGGCMAGPSPTLDRDDPLEVARPSKSEQLAASTLESLSSHHPAPDFYFLSSAGPSFHHQ